MLVQKSETHGNYSHVLNNLPISKAIKRFDIRCQFIFFVYVCIASWTEMETDVFEFIHEGVIGSASLARSIRIRFHFRHRTGRIRSASDHRAGRVWRSRHRSKTPSCLPGARDQVPALFQNAIERRGASVNPNSGAPITQSTFDMLGRMANPLSLLNWWLHKYDDEDDYALFQV